MFSCCRCVNPKSPKYKRKGEDGNESSVEEDKDGFPDENLSSEEEIKVEIIETEGKPLESVEETQECGETTAPVVVSGNDSPSVTKSSSEGEQENQNQPNGSLKSPPNEESSTLSEQQQQQQQQSVAEVEAETPTAGESPASPETTNDSPEEIPTTIAEVVEATETTAINETTENQSESENKNNIAIVEQPSTDDTTSQPKPKSESEQEEKRDQDSNADESQSSSDTDNITSENLEQPSEIEILPAPVCGSPETQKELEEDEEEALGEQEPPLELDRAERLKSDTSQVTIEETIDVQRYLPKETGNDENLQLIDVKGESDKDNEDKSDENHVDRTSPDKVSTELEEVEGTGDSVSDSNKVESSAEPEPEAESSQTPSRKESANSDDTTIRTQLSYRESCLSRRSSSKSSIKKKVAYNESTEIIPPREYSPVMMNDDDEVFSDSIPPKLPRGDMCTPFATKRGSIPGLIALPDWFAEDRLMMLV